MKYHWLICDQIINALPRIGWIFTGYLDGTLIKGYVCFGGVADWVWGAKRSKESHRLGCHYGFLQNWLTVFCGAGVVWCYVRFWILRKCQKSQNQYWQMRLWVPKQGNLSQPSPTARVSVAPVRMEIPSLVCTTVHCNRPPSHQNTEIWCNSAVVADRIKALLGTLTLRSRLWENLAAASSVSFFQFPYKIQLLSVFHVMLMVMCENVAWMFQNALVLP